MSCPRDVAEIRVLQGPPPPPPGSPTDYDETRASPNTGETGKFASALPVYAGIDMIFTELHLPPRPARCTPLQVVDIELHPLELPVPNKSSPAQHSCVVPTDTPAAIHARFLNWTRNYPETDPGAHQPGALGLTNAIAVTPAQRPWSRRPRGGSRPPLTRERQFNCCPKNQCTLHGVQGKTADPDLVAHWQFPARLKPDTI